MPPLFSYSYAYPYSYLRSSSVPSPNHDHDSISSPSLNLSKNRINPIQSDPIVQYIPVLPSHFPFSPFPRSSLPERISLLLILLYYTVLLEFAVKPGDLIPYYSILGKMVKILKKLKTDQIRQMRYKNKYWMGN